MRVSPNVILVDSSSTLASLTVSVAVPILNVWPVSSLTPAARVGFDPAASIIASVPCAVTAAEPAEGRARTSTSTIATDPSSATFGKEPIRPSSSRLCPLSSVKDSTLLPRLSISTMPLPFEAWTARTTAVPGDSLNGRSSDPLAPSPGPTTLTATAETCGRLEGGVWG